MAKGIADEIMGMLTAYCGDLGEKMQSAAEKLSKQASKDLEAASPKKTGEYAKSWHLSRFGGRGRFRIVIHNDEYQLTHLLESGFKHFPDGGKIEGRLHIAPVQEKLNEDFYKACEDLVKEE